MFYLDPKVAVGTVIRSNDGRRIVLVRRAIEPGYGKWVFPGGYVDRGEDIREAAIREAREEADWRSASIASSTSTPTPAGCP